MDVHEFLMKFEVGVGLVDVDWLIRESVIKRRRLSVVDFIV